MRRWESTPLRGRERTKERSIKIVTKGLITQNQVRCIPNVYNSRFALNKFTVEYELVCHYLITHFCGLENTTLPRSNSLEILAKHQTLGGSACFKRL